MTETADQAEETAGTRRPVDVRDVMLVVGLLALGAGLWFVWPPLAAIVPGTVLTGIAIFGVR